MAVLPVTKFPNPVLMTQAAEIETITAAERELVRDMIDTMYAESGVGLAANQVGVLKQIFVASADQARGQEMVFFNPKIMKQQGTIKEFEGCLSIPEFYEPVKRSKKVWLRAMTLDGKTVEVVAEGLLARIFQHEVDHLNGILFVDRLGPVKSRLAKKSLTRKATLL
jgi:peptide deformylase